MQSLLREHPVTPGGAGELLEVDLQVPDYPPHRLTLLDGLLGLFGRLEGSR